MEIDDCELEQDMKDRDYAAFASVVIDKGPPAPLDYGLPEELAAQVQPGARVEVTLRGKPRLGTVTAVSSSTTQRGIQPILGLHGAQPKLPSDLLQLARWLPSYYLASEAAALRCISPSYLRRQVATRPQLLARRLQSREKLAEVCVQLRSRAPAQANLLERLIAGPREMPLADLLKASGVSRSAASALENKKLIAITKAAEDSEPLAEAEFFSTAPKQLNIEQQEALERIYSSLDANVYATHLLFGVTGSGKTEVYLQAVERALAAGKGVVVLVPEIALTEQTVERFRSRFRDRVAVLHHRLSDGERCALWHRVHNGELKIVVGPRSAIFSPMKTLGLIIVDEEHDQSYKQSEQDPRYNARDVAVMRATLTGSTVILGSATPSLESFYNASRGKYQLSLLASRADGAHLPNVRLVDMKCALDRSEGFTLFSDELLTAIRKRAEAGEQTLLFLNRRGYFAMQWCRSCRQAIQCPHCDLNLTFHRGQGILSCHLCGYFLAPPPRRCPTCSAEDPLSFRGAGTEQVEQGLRRVFPDIRTVRCDADTTRAKGSHQKLLRAFRSGKADVLIGTQMIAKGLHFPQVTLVGVINGDAGLHIPDFRASEYAFQLITQVAGRAGRAQMGGEVIIQSFMPGNATLKLAACQDYPSFYKQEVETRKLFNFPPFSQLVKVTLSGVDSAAVEAQAKSLQQAVAAALPPGFEAMPANPCGYPKVNGQYRFQFLLRGPSVRPLTQALQQLSALRAHGNGRLRIDVNPLTTFS